MKQKDIIFILGSAFFVVIVWIILEVYQGAVNSTISEKLNVKIIPITADFDSKTIQDIKNRNVIEPLYRTLEAPPTTTTQEPLATPSSVIEPEIEINKASQEGALLP